MMRSHTIHLPYNQTQTMTMGSVSLSSRSEMVLDGVIPIDHLRDFMKPMQLMMNRITIKQWDDVYNLKLVSFTGNKINYEDVLDQLDVYCKQKKMFNKGQVPDRNKAARVILKDYVKGKIIYNHASPKMSNPAPPIKYYFIMIRINCSSNVVHRISIKEL
eukprot:978409_1